MAEGMLPIFVPSLGRSSRLGGTLPLLASAEIPCTVVVEPHEADDYRRWLQGSVCAVAVLPEGGKGVSYVRNHILHKLAPVQGWFWIIDDDVSKFHGVRDGKVVDVPPGDALAAAVVLEAAADPKVAIVGLEYYNFMSNRERKCPAQGRPDGINTYCNVAVALNRERLPPSAAYRFRSREDFDFALQVISAGLRTRRIRRLGFNNGGMGNTIGGMWSFYDKAEREDVVSCTAFLWTWRSLWGTGAVAKEYLPARSSGAGAGRDRLHVRVTWTKLARSELRPAPTVTPTVRPQDLPPEGHEQQNKSARDLCKGSVVALRMGGDCEEVRGGWWTAEVTGREGCGRYWLRWLRPNEFLPDNRISAEQWGTHGDWLLDLPDGGDWRLLRAAPGPPLMRPAPKGPQPAAVRNKESPQWFADMEKELAKDAALCSLFAERCGNDFSSGDVPSAEEFTEHLSADGVAVTAADTAPLTNAMIVWLRLLKSAFLAATRDKGLPVAGAKVSWKNGAAYAAAFFQVCKTFHALKRPSSAEEWRVLVRLAARSCMAVGLPLSSYGPARLRVKVDDYLAGGTRYSPNTGALSLQERLERAARLSARRASPADPSPPTQSAAAAPQAAPPLTPRAPAAKRPRRGARPPASAPADATSVELICTEVVLPPAAAAGEGRSAGTVAEPSGSAAPRKRRKRRRKTSPQQGNTAPVTSGPAPPAASPPAAAVHPSERPQRRIPPSAPSRPDPASDRVRKQGPQHETQQQRRIQAPHGAASRRQSEEEQPAIATPPSAPQSAVGVHGAAVVPASGHKRPRSPQAPRTPAAADQGGAAGGGAPLKRRRASAQQGGSQKKAGPQQPSAAAGRGAAGALRGCAPADAAQVELICTEVLLPPAAAAGEGCSAGTAAEP
eukprot:TRINITY_DN7006_c0_g1_i4.p1 TRINITY_DN7006_c0_g1~~TRINITY_DN7006_c0_g1_i4.p1  ORF type:complete len:894 (+),score=147.36 TRINITY_DN7006_c0_g1_i4:68-2749(+)